MRKLSVVALLIGGLVFGGMAMAQSAVTSVAADGCSAPQKSRDS